MAFPMPRSRVEWATLAWRAGMAVALTLVGAGQVTVRENASGAAVSCSEVAGVVQADGTARAVLATVVATAVPH